MTTASASSHFSPAPRATPVSLLDYDRIGESPVQRDPFEFVIVERVLEPGQLAAVVSDFPHRIGPGSHPVGLVRCGPVLDMLIAELNGAPFRAIVEKKFGISLDGLPTACTLRAETVRSDGRIHTDSASKVITVLLYLNAHWTSDAGRLRLLRSANDIEDYAVEVPPFGGSLLIFRRSDASWHGHKPFVGPRKSIQFNWVQSRATRWRENARHSVSHALKRVGLAAGF